LCGPDRLTAVQDARSYLTSYTYDELSWLRAVFYPAGKAITYTCDAAGNRSVLVDPDADRVTYSYDSRNHLEWLVNRHDERTTYVYDGVGRVTTMTHGNGTIAETDYDDAGRIEAVRNLKSDGSTVLSIFTYSYDDSGNRTGVAEANGDRVTWSYDGINQLTQEARSGANAYGLEYTYDAVGNRLTQFNGAATVSYSYDVANQLTLEENPSARITYSYDANGNTEVMNAAGSLTTYSWDVENHMTGVELADATLNTITYDGDGKRRQYEDGAGLRKFIWDGENILLQTDSGGTTNRDYTYNPQGYGHLISQSNLFHHYDALGSTMQLTDETQGAVVSYLYRAFGEQTVLSGSSANRFTWVGRLGYYRQPDTSDYWVRARIYRPTIGRWVSRDPFALSHYLGLPDYGYVRNRPCLLSDPSGELAWYAVAGAIIAAIAVYQGFRCLKALWSLMRRQKELAETYPADTTQEAFCILSRTPEWQDAMDRCPNLLVGQYT